MPGRLEQVGTHAEVYYRPATPFVASFFGDNNLIQGVRAKGGVQTALGLLDIGLTATDAGGPVLVSIRPELSGLCRETRRRRAQKEEAWRTLRATVRKVTFAGALTRVVVSPDIAPNLELLVKVTSTADTGGFASGDTVTIMLQEPRTCR